MNHCINCGTEVSSKYCPNCGQSNPPRKITLTQLWSDFQARIYGFDGMFPRTLRDLTLRPGKAARVFIEGNRVLYYGPVGYFFLMITVLLLLMSVLDVNVIDFMKSAANQFNGQKSVKEGSGQQKFMQSVFQFASDNMKLLSFTQIPLLAFFSRYLFFRKSGLNFLEHTVLPFYLHGHIYWVSILSVLFYKITDNFFPPGIAMIIAPLYISFGYSGMFDYQSRTKRFFKGLGIYICAQLLFIVIIAITVILLVVFNPEVRELIRPSNN